MKFSHTDQEANANRRTADELDRLEIELIQLRNRLNFLSTLTTTNWRLNREALRTEKLATRQGRKAKA